MTANLWKTNICPYCQMNRNDPTARRLALILIGSTRHKIVSEIVNPGGRELRFEDGTRIQLADQCNWCDYFKIKKILA